MQPAFTLYQQFHILASMVQWLSSYQLKSNKNDVLVANSKTLPSSGRHYYRIR